MTSPTSRIRRLEIITRARGDHLYASSGRRYLDLYRDGGRAILGHRSGRIVRERKNLLEKGLAATLPSTHEARLERALKHLFPDAREVRAFTSYERAMSAVGSFLGIHDADVVVFDPVVEYVDHPPASAMVWRPFLPDEIAATLDASATAILPVLPVPGETTQVVLFPDGSAPASDVVPADRLVSIGRSIADLQMCERIEPLPLRGFRAVGPYLVPDPADELVYDEWFTEFVLQGILISPDLSVPSVSPCEVSDGERMRVLRMAAGIVGKEEPLRGN